MAELKTKGNEKTRSTYARHGMAKDRVIGVSAADMKAIAKTIKGQQALACELYATGIMDAMYLAGMVANGSKMTREQLQSWAEGSKDLQMISEHTVPWVASESPFGRPLAVRWIGSPQEHVAVCGWRTYAGLVMTKPDEELDLAEVESLLDEVVREIHASANRVRYTMNGFVISVGTYVMPLLSRARAAAEAIGAVSVDVGETACQVPLALDRIPAAGQIGKKRKTMRC